VERRERPTVLIVSDEVELADAIRSHWQAAGNATSFVMKTSSECGHDNFDLAIAGGLQEPAAVLETLRETGKPVIHVSRLKGGTPKLTGVVSLPEAPGWTELLAIVVREVLERERTAAELTRALEANSQLQHQASLGRYMIDTRHNVNNALTSILGNCDLILLDEQELPGTVKNQVETIRNMGMRLNEIMQRFSSLEKEMQLMEQQSRKAKSATAGV
jgi:signal transduction histidine kinase